MIHKTNQKEYERTTQHAGAEKKTYGALKSPPPPPPAAGLIGAGSAAVPGGGAPMVTSVIWMQVILRQRAVDEESDRCARRIFVCDAPSTPQCAAVSIAHRDRATAAKSGSAMAQNRVAPSARDDAQCATRQCIATRTANASAHAAHATRASTPQAQHNKEPTTNGHARTNQPPCAPHARDSTPAAAP